MYVPTGGVVKHLGREVKRCYCDTWKLRRFEMARVACSLGSVRFRVDLTQTVATCTQGGNDWEVLVITGRKIASLLPY